VSIARQLVVLLPVAYALAHLAGINSVWWSFPVAEMVSFAITLIFMRKLYKDVISKIGA